MDAPSRLLHQIHVRYAPVDARVAEILEHIRADCADLGRRKYNEGNERQLEQFVARVEAEFPGRVVIQRQRLSKWAVRTTRWNYVFTVPGDSDDQVVLVAHYDTWRGPGADDNTTGEEILKQYLLSDLKAGTRPKLTHVYFFAGSEECGLVGLFSQLLLSFGLFAGNFALTYRDWGMLAVAIALLPLASYRFGVSGSREYVRTLSPDALKKIRAVVSIDSVGEGRLYIPRETMGADFIRVLIPFGDYDSLNDLLEEAAHLHGIKYNNFLAGGTTDHVSFLEVNNGLWARARDGLRRIASSITGRPYAPPFRIPATALVAMRPGKASPIVFGGKIHTPKDTPDRVYPEPLRETLLILDYFFYRIEGGPRLTHPRELGEFHYARLYRTDTGHLVAFKDAVEPNRRNLNAVYRASVTRTNGRAVATLGEIVSWGVESRLPREVREVCADAGLTQAAEPVQQLEVSGDGMTFHFGRHTSALDTVRRAYHEAVNGLQSVVRRFLFVTFFALAYVLASVSGWLMDVAFDRWPGFALWVANHVGITLTAIMLLEVAILLHLMARRIPAWIDNSYKHANRADNLGSLKRIGATTF
jgi:peptidase M28-like protein